MNRRSFMKSLVCSPLALVCIPKQVAAEDIRLQPDKNYFDLPDKIMSFHQHEGRFFAVCENSIWEIKEKDNKLGAINMETKRYVDQCIYFEKDLVT